MGDMKKRERASNFEKSEVHLLTELVTKYKSVLENKKTDAVTNEEKEAVWSAIATTFNAASSGHAVRMSKALKLKYEGLKKCTKKKMTLHRQELYRTGGGPFAAPAFNEVEEKVLAICSNISGLDARNDSDNFPDKAGTNLPANAIPVCKDIYNIQIDGETSQTAGILLPAMPVMANEPQPQIEEVMEETYAAKVRIHGMQDENWVIKDKINQYRGLIKLYERDRKIHEGDLAKQKKRYCRDIRQLRKDITTRRDELGVAVYGDKQFLRNAFQEHRRLQLTYMNSQADKVLESLQQENFNKRKQLDRIRYTKKKKMEKFRLTQLESAELRDRLLYEIGGKRPAEKKEQAVANYVQRANIKKNAALAIKVMYKKILDILKKDSTYFTVVLDALKLDCRAQGKCLMGATEMGQLAMEYLDDRKFEFNKLEKEIKANMKERARTLKLVRREVAYLTDSFPSLIRKEEATNLDDLYEDEDAGSHHSVHWELEEVMGICKRLQKATLVSSFDQILQRLKEQSYQTERLMTQLTLNSRKRNALIEDRKHAVMMLDSLKNVGQERTAEYINEKNQIKAKLEAEEREEKNLTQQLNEKGKLIIEMKTSLQQINQLLSSVASPNADSAAFHERPLEFGGTSSLTNLSASFQRGAPNAPRPFSGVPRTIQYALDDMIQPVPEVEADLDKLILTAKQKLNVLIGAVSQMEVTPEVRQTANFFYHNILARFMRDNYKDEVVAEGGLIEFEMEDPNVPGHAVIKLRSKQLVEAQVSEFDVVDPKK